MANFDQTPSGQSLASVTRGSSDGLVIGSATTNAALVIGVGSAQNHSVLTAEEIVQMPVGSGGGSPVYPTTGQRWPYKK